MRPFVKFATRLDAVIRLREKAEEEAQLALAEAHRHLEEMKRNAKRMRELAREDGRAGGSAQLWELAENANARALHEVNEVEKKVAVAGDHLSRSQQRYAGAYRHAEVIRRVATARRAEMMAEAEAFERKEFDEISILLHVRS